MSLDRLIIKEIPYQTHISRDWIVRILSTIPEFSENDPKNPEWIATPTIPLDLRSKGYGIVYVKDESNPRSNPTRTAKDRPAHEIALLYRNFALTLEMLRESGRVNGNLDSILIPTFTVFTYGNWGTALARKFEKWGLPPPNLVIPDTTPDARVEILKGEYANIFMVNSSERELSTEDIKGATSHPESVDITSVMTIEPWSIFYDWLCHEVFNEAPDMVFVPYGSARLYENLHHWQWKSIRNHFDRRPDPRLQVPIEVVASMQILGATPSDKHSSADYLTAPFNPFIIFDKNDIEAQNTLLSRGATSGIYGVREELIREAPKLIEGEVFETSPTGSAGLALYMQLWDQGLIPPNKKVLIVNTGRGI
ncbi:pyridoxal-phosphate dependent enzyme [Candidatus Woesearchaeota archaeon]|nr:MAG: pyridoxal-phosphate dependent enzyme [Candidatus Woesearchaeota archaeon]